MVLDYLLENYIVWPLEPIESKNFWTRT